MASESHNAKSNEEGKELLKNYKTTVNKLQKHNDHVLDADNRSILWTDGSLIPDTKEGAAAIVWNPTPGTVGAVSFGLVNLTSSTEAELVAILLASTVKNCHILTDSQASIALIQKSIRIPKWIQGIVLSIRQNLSEGNSKISYIPAHLEELNFNLNEDLVKLASTTEIPIQFLWEGNKEVDKWTHTPITPWPKYRKEDPKFIPVDTSQAKLPIRQFKQQIKEILSKSRRKSRKDIEETFTKSQSSADYFPRPQKASDLILSRGDKPDTVTPRLLLGKLPVRHYLSEQQRKHPDQFKTSEIIPPTCPVCGHEAETVRHFLICPDLPSLREEITTISTEIPIANSNPLEELTLLDIFCGFLPKNLDTNTKNIQQLQYSLSKTIVERWKTRCSFQVFFGEFSFCFGRTRKTIQFQTPSFTILT